MQIHDAQFRIESMECSVGKRARERLGKTMAAEK